MSAPTSDCIRSISSARFGATRNVFQSFSSSSLASTCCSWCANHSGSAGACGQLLGDGFAQPRGAGRAAVIERRLRLAQQAQQMAYRCVVRRPLRRRPPLGLAFGFEDPGPLGGGLGRGLRLLFVLPLRCRGGQRGGSSLLRLRLDRQAVTLDDLARLLQLLCDLALHVVRHIGFDRAPARLEMPERGCVRRVVRPLGVARDGGGGRLDLGLLLLDLARLGEQFIALVGEDPVDGLVLAVARRPDQFAQLLRIRDAAGRHLADAGRAALEHPCADRGEVAGRDQRGQLRFFFPCARLGIGSRRRRTWRPAGGLVDRDSDGGGDLPSRRERMDIGGE